MQIAIKQQQSVNSRTHERWAKTDSFHIQISRITAVIWQKLPKYLISERSISNKWTINYFKTNKSDPMWELKCILIVEIWIELYFCNH